MHKTRKKTIRHKKSYLEDGKSNIWHTMVSLILVLLYPLLVLGTNSIYFFEMIVFYTLFFSIQFLGMIKGLFRKKEANGFFLSIKAIDIYAHIFGGLAFYYISLVFLDLELLMNLIFIILIGITWEFLEFGFERILEKLEIKGFVQKQTHTKFISEPLGNTIQDIISNSIGAFIGFLIIIAGVNF